MRGTDGPVAILIDRARAFGRRAVVVSRRRERVRAMSYEHTGGVAKLAGEHNAHRRLEDSLQVESVDRVERDWIRGVRSPVWCERHRRPRLLRAPVGR